ATLLAADARRIGQVQHRVACGTELHALVAAGQKARAPKPRQQTLVGNTVGGQRIQHYKRRQVLVGATQPVVDPGADTGPARQLAAGLDERDGGVVVDRLGVHGAQHADLVGDFTGVREQLAEPASALAVLPETVHARHNRKTILVRHHAGDALAAEDGRRDILVEA